MRFNQPAFYPAEPIDFAGLATVAAMLENLPAEVILDMNNWMINLPCGTRACAAGHAAQLPEFVARGLKLKWYRDSADVIFIESGREHYDHAALTRFFNISRDVSDHLFGYNYPEAQLHCDDNGDRVHNPRIVAERFRAFIRDHQPVVAAEA